jgi:hypothetical protein
MKTRIAHTVPSGFRMIVFFMAIIMMFSSCKFYHNTSYKAMKDSVRKTAQRDNFNYIIVHNGNSYWNLRYPRVKEEFITGELEPLDAQVDSVYRLSLVKRNYRGKNDSHLHEQLHLHVDEFEAAGNQVTIPFSTVTKIEIEKENRGLTLITNTAIATGSVIGGFTALLVLTCNCPHNYVFDGKNYYFNNTLFTGANTPNLERDDYKSLPDFFPDSSTYRMIIKNEESEIQYTNLLELLAIDHAPNVKAVTTQGGKILTIESPVWPVSLTNDRNEDVSPFATTEDDLFYGFDQTGSDDLSHLYAKFQ